MMVRGGIIVVHLKRCTLYYVIIPPIRFHSFRENE